MNDEINAHRQKRHRVVGRYLVLQAWLDGLDCIVLGRSQLKAFLDCENIVETHVKQFKADIAKWFPHSQVLRLIKGNRSIEALFLSRFPIPTFPGSSLNTDERIAKINGEENAPRIGRLSKALSHKQMVDYLSKFAADLEYSQLKADKKVTKPPVPRPLFPRLKG